MLKTAFVSSFFWASLGAIWMKVGGHHPETSWTFLSAAEPQMLSRKPQKAQTNKSPYTALSIPFNVSRGHEFDVLESEFEVQKNQFLRSEANNAM